MNLKNILETELFAAAACFYSLCCIDVVGWSLTKQEAAVLTVPCFCICVLNESLIICSHLLTRISQIH